MTDFYKAPFAMTPVAGVRERVDWATVLAAQSGLLGWFSARAAHLTKDSSNNITQINNRGGNTFPLIVIPSSSTSKSPTYSASGGANGSPSISFNGTNDVMQWGTASGGSGYIPTAGDFTKAVIFKTAGTPSGPQHLFSRSNNQAQSLYLNGSTAYGQVGSSPAATASTPYTPMQWQLAIHSFDYSTNTSKIAVNGGPIASTTTASAATTQNPAYLGGSTSVPANPFAGDIAEVFVFSNDILDPANAVTRALIEQFARDVRGVNL